MKLGPKEVEGVLLCSSPVCMEEPWGGSQSPCSCSRTSVHSRGACAAWSLCKDMRGTLFYGLLRAAVGPMAYLKPRPELRAASLGVKRERWGKSLGLSRRTLPLRYKSI